MGTNARCQSDFSVTYTLHLQAKALIHPKQCTFLRNESRPASGAVGVRGLDLGPNREIILLALGFEPLTFLSQTQCPD